LKVITIKIMKKLKILFLLVLLFTVHGTASGMPLLPDSFKDGTMVRVEEPRTWTSETMYEHVNGEAELLKRYGATGLAYAFYENQEGDYLSVDILDMTAPVNAFGLYSLYAGCDGDEYSVSGATVLSGDFTSYAVFGRYFMRIDFEAAGGNEGGRSLVSTFLSEFSTSASAPGPLPPAVKHLKKLARKTCEVSYHPEHLDYDLEAGPGYSWIGSDGGTYFMSFLPSPKQAEDLGATLRKKGVPTAMAHASVVGWSKAGTEEAENYLNRVLSEAVKW
jgi:hypothetical protein